MTVYNWLSIFAVPSLVSAFVLFCIRWLNKKIKAARERTDAETTALKLGMQALLRDRLYAEYREAEKRGYTELWQRQNFANMYKQYHFLGANGVMDDTKERYFALPDIVKAEEKGNE